MSAVATSRRRTNPGPVKRFLGGVLKRAEWVLSWPEFRDRVTGELVRLGWHQEGKPLEPAVVRSLETAYRGAARAYRSGGQEAVEEYLKGFRVTGGRSRNPLDWATVLGVGVVAGAVQGMVEPYVSRHVYARNPSPKPVAQMTAGELNRELDKLDALDSRLTEEMIRAGRGNERPSEYLVKADPLALRLRAAAEQRRVLRAEVERRYGPGAPSRLPKGFGPTRHNPELTDDPQLEKWAQDHARHMKPESTRGWIRRAKRELAEHREYLKSRGYEDDGYALTKVRNIRFWERALEIRKELGLPMSSTTGRKRKS